ncbi:MAG: hypothetical protein JWR38_4546 [Mucilaginibacter sp.]|nr:hypothetical protein [Mucilaginibacter sp.]
MKKLELKDLGVQEMNTAEMTKVDGGGILGDIIGNTVATVALGAGLIVYNTVAFLQFSLTKLLGLVLS